MEKMLAVQFIQRCPTFVSILGKLNCKSYRSTSSGNSSKCQEKKVTPHRLVDFTKKNIQLLMDFAVYYRTKFKFKFWFQVQADGSNDLGLYPEVRFVTAFTAGGSVKFLPAV